MKKHALMLTAAWVAMMAGPALADTTITTKVTTVQKTSTAGNIIIGSTTTSSSGTTTTTTGSVVVTTSGPAIEIDSNNYVNSTLAGNTISNIGTTGATGVRFDATAAGNGPGAGVYALDNFGAIDLTGSGTGKAGILIGLGAPGSTVSSGTFNGGIHLESGSTLSVTGDSSYGIQMVSGVVMNGNIAIDGGIAMNPTTASSTSASSLIAVDLAGTLNGNFSVASSGTISATGAGAQGVVLAGDGAMTGSFTNSGTIQTLGIAATSVSVTGASTNYPEAGSAVVIGNSIKGGFYNAGPSSTGSTTPRATISAAGSGPAISISPVSTSTTSSTTVPVDIGKYATELGGAYGFINRGTIATKPTDPDANATGISMSGGSASEVTIEGGIWNSGAITVSAATDTKATTTVSAIGLSIGDYVKVPTLVNDNAESNSGAISAAVSGVNSATATAIYVGTHGELDSLNNSGSIIASVATTDTKVSTMNAYAIQDLSGTLSTINNSGSITASATTLDNGSQTRVAADLSHNSSPTGITFTDTGTVIGDILLGSGPDKITVNGTSATAAASINGNISFNGGGDTLTIGDNASVTGALTERGGGAVAVTVGTGSGTGTLTLTNSTTTLGAANVTGLNVSNLTVASGGTLNLTVSQPFNATNPTTATSTSTVKYAGAIISSTGPINLDPNSNFNLNYGSFLSTPGGTGTSQFVLLDAPATKLTVGNYAAIDTAVKNNIPYLFTGGLCGYNLAGSTACTPLSGSSDATAATDSQLVLQLAPKTIGTGPDQLPLTGNAAKIFSYANAAMANDDPLGAAVVSNVRDATTAQAAYASFLPDLSGSSRQVAIDITDQATGPVGARQRALRMYAAQPGGATMWGQEFADRDSSGGNVDAYRTNGWGFALGMDDGDPRNGRYGVALTFFSGDQTNKGPNFTKTSNLWYMLSGYTDWRGKGLFLDSQLSVGYGSLTGKRYLQLTDINNKVVYSRVADGKRAGLLLAAGVSTGVVLTYGSTVITPQLSIDGLTMREEGYTESGGGSTTTGADGFDLKVNPYYANSLRGYLGTAVREDLKLGDYYVQPQMRVGYRYDFLADPVKLKMAFASMASTTGSQFTLTGSDPQRGDLIGGLGLAVTTGAWSLGVDYDYVKGNGSSSTQAGMVTLVGRI